MRLHRPVSVPRPRVSPSPRCRPLEIGLPKACARDPTPFDTRVMHPRRLSVWSLQVLRGPPRAQGAVRAPRAGAVTMQNQNFDNDMCERSAGKGVRESLGSWCGVFGGVERYAWIGEFSRSSLCATLVMDLEVALLFLACGCQSCSLKRDSPMLFEMRTLHKLSNWSTVQFNCLKVRIRVADQ